MPDPSIESPRAWSWFAAAIVAEAAEGSVAGVILITPWDSLVDLVGTIYPFLPARWLMKDRYDCILFDTPPVMAVADARVLGSMVDTTLFVVRWDKNPRKVSRAALNQLRQAGNDIVGTVLQQVDLKRYGRFGYGDSGYYYHYGRYGKYYSS